MLSKKTALFICCFLFAATSAVAFKYTVNNDFIQDAFPAEVSSRIFSIPMDPARLVVVHPVAGEDAIEEMKRILATRTDRQIPFISAEQADRSSLSGKDIIVLGNISDNRYSLELYKRRFAFADAYFPGEEGVIITPSKSIWDNDRNVIVVGYSSSSGMLEAFREFVSLIPQNAASIGPLRLMKTSLVNPRPPESITSTLVPFSPERAAPRPNYSGIAHWGVYYHLTGDQKWASHFMEAMRYLYDRAEETGWWIAEPWTNVYFALWRLIYAWELIDDDPFFSMEDRKIVDEVLWGYAKFCDWLPNLDPELAPPDEARQNHTTFLALSLYKSYRYFNGKYSIPGLEGFMEKVELAFDRGEAASSRPNDDAGGYLNYAPLHLITYQLDNYDLSFIQSDKMSRLADLVAAVNDNRGDPVTLGDVGGYSHRTEQSPRLNDAAFFSMAAWGLEDGRYKWLYNWATFQQPGLTGSGARFSLEDIYRGSYAVEMAEEFPSHLVGVQYFPLDDGALRWSSMRSWKNSFIPLKNDRYFDKLTFRNGFSPEDEYMLINGLSTFSHGHYDGNTVNRLTWKDRIWLFDLDYIKLTPRYHNGVTITSNGIQEEPPPLTVLDHIADFPGTGYSISTARDFNNSDWTRMIYWKKGKWFLFLDRVTAMDEGDFRMEQRWRTRGEVSLEGNSFSVVQGDASMTIKSADSSHRRIVYEPDTLQSNWNYPYGDGQTAVLVALKEMPMGRNSEHAFANLLYVSMDSDNTKIELLQAGEGVYVISENGRSELAGFEPAFLKQAGISTNCAMFTVESEKLILIGTRYFSAGNVAIISEKPYHIEIDLRVRKALLIVPDGSEGTYDLTGAILRGSKTRAASSTVVLEPGEHILDIRQALPRLDTFLATSNANGIAVFPTDERVEYFDFGFHDVSGTTIPQNIVSFSQWQNQLYLGDNEGNILRYAGGKVERIAVLGGGNKTATLHVADLDGDGEEVIIAGDSNENIYCFSRSGALLWSYKMTRYFGANANATHITSEDIDGNGRKSVLASTNGWKLYCFDAAGQVRWESFVHYHPLTKAAYLQNPDRSYIAVGTIYMTPLNMVDPETGANIWFTWEEMGSEFIADTPFCGIHLTDMVFVDTNLDGNMEVVFGTQYNTVYALTAETGEMKWEANTGDEVTIMKTMVDHETGQTMIVVGTAYGDVVVFDRNGRRMMSAALGGAVTDMLILPHPEWKRNDIIISTEEGGVFALDDETLLIRAVLNLGEKVEGLFFGEKAGTEETIMAVTAKGINTLIYQPFNLRKMRTD